MSSKDCNVIAVYDHMIFPPFLMEKYMYTFFNKICRLNLSNKKHQRAVENAAVGIVGLSSAAWAYSMKYKWIEHEVNFFKSQLTEEERKAIDKSPATNQQYLKQCKDELRENIMSSVL